MTPAEFQDAVILSIFEHGARSTFDAFVAALVQARDLVESRDMKYRISKATEHIQIARDIMKRDNRP